MPEQETIGHLVRLRRRTLADGLLGVHLHGSATLGGLRPGSDLDLMVVARRSCYGSPAGTGTGTSS